MCEFVPRSTSFNRANATNGYTCTASFIAAKILKIQQVATFGPPKKNHAAAGDVASADHLRAVTDHGPKKGRKRFLVAIITHVLLLSATERLSLFDRCARACLDRCHRHAPTRRPADPSTLLIAVIKFIDLWPHHGTFRSLIRSCKMFRSAERLAVKFHHRRHARDSPGSVLLSIKLI